MQTLEVVKDNKQTPEYSLIVPFTRDWMVDKWFDWLRTSTPDFAEATEVIAYVDSDNPELLEQIKEQDVGKFGTFKVLFSGKESVGNISVSWRKDRICEVYNHLRLLVNPDSKYVIGIEDDTTIDGSNGITRLVNGIKSNPVIGFYSGVQAGRWVLPYIGAWEVDNLVDPQMITTCEFNQTLKQVDGCGMYAFVTTAELFKAHRFHRHSDSAEIFGPDVNFVMSVKKAGKLAYCDMGLIALHHLADGAIKDPRNMEIEKFFWQKRKGKWERGEDFSWGTGV